MGGGAKKNARRGFLRALIFDGECMSQEGQGCQWGFPTRFIVAQKQVGGNCAPGECPTLIRQSRLPKLVQESVVLGCGSLDFFLEGVHLLMHGL